MAQFFVYKAVVMLNQLIWLRMRTVILFILVCYGTLVKAQNEKAFEIYGAGVRAFYAQDYSGALQMYNQALALKPDMVAALYNRGLVYLKLDSITQAKADFEKIVQIDTGYIDALYQIGKIQMDAKQYDKALIVFNDIVKRAPSHLKALSAMGVIYYYKRKYKEAEECYTNIINIAPNDDDAWYKRGLMKMTKEEYDGAISDFSQAYKVNPGNLMALDQRAMSYYKANNTEKACEDWKTLAAKNYPRVQDNITKYCK